MGQKHLTLSELKTMVGSLSGASAVGVAAVGAVSEKDREIYRNWLSDSRNGEMHYLERYAEVRDNPALLLDGARSIVMAAFSFANPQAVKEMSEGGRPLISEYALGEDYHIEIRRRLGNAAAALTEAYGGETRVCVDTAPLRERYWARQAGLGFIGINNYLIIPGQGAHFCLGALLWTGVPSDGFDSPCEVVDCGRCGRCVEACPGGALAHDGRMDARKCLSYITIESRDEVPASMDFGGRVFGCDTCRRVCPHQPGTPPQTTIEALKAREAVVSLTADDWLAMTPARFKKLFGGSAVMRGRLCRLQSIVESGRSKSSISEK